MNAVLIAPVVAGGETILPAGSLISGKLKSVQRVGLGFVHELAALDLEFTGITAPNGESVSAAGAGSRSGQCARASDARRAASAATRPTSSLSYRFGGYIRTAIEWELHAAAGDLGD